MDKEYYYSLNDEEKVIYKNAVKKTYKKSWDAEHPEAIYQHRRATTLKRCRDRCSVPTKNTVEKYKFTKEELEPIFNLLWKNWTSGSESDSSNSGC